MAEGEGGTPRYTHRRVFKSGPTCPARDGRPRAEAAFVSRGTPVPLSLTTNTVRQWIGTSKPVRTPGSTNPHICLDPMASTPRFVTFRLVVVSLLGPGQSPVLPFACCVGSLLSVSHCGRCSCWCRFRVREAQWLVCWGCAECGRVCRLRVSGARLLGLCWLLWGSFDCFCCPHTSVLRPSTTCVAAFPCACGPGALLLHALSRPSTAYAPPLLGTRVRRARSLLVVGRVRFMGDAGGVRACMVSWVIYAAL